MQYTTLLFDLDETLYPAGSGLWPDIRDRIGQYMVERLGLPAEEVPAIRRRYYEQYGTTLRGLQYHHHVDTDDFLAYVHDLPIHEYIAPNPTLRSLILSLPQARWIFTNADSNHAQRVLAAEDLQGCFTGIIDIRRLEFACKPEPEAYRRALAVTGETDARRCVMLDDVPANLAPARDMGFTTVLVNPQADGHPAAHHTIPSLLSLPLVLPELWESV